jgi:hypothetical protein
VLRTRSPLLFKCIATSEKPFDLHVLTTPPAFILSQDQTLRKKRVTNPSDSWTTIGTDPKARSVYNLEYVDWGSQSIVQSKFQRTASFLGKDVQENIRVLVRQYFSRILSKKVLEGTLFSLSPWLPHSRFARESYRRERGTWELDFLNQGFFGLKN